VQFNNIGDNLGQLFGGFAQAISPALSAAFKVINDIFDSAFPDLNSIVDFFAPLTESAQQFADVLGSSPGVIEVIAAGLKSLGGVIIQGIADNIAYVSGLISKIDQKAFIQGFINAELVVRRLLLAAQALGMTLAKNAELSFRAASNPIQFGKDILEAGGFGKFIEKEFEDVERKWNDWANSEPLTFPDLTGQAAKQTDAIAGNLSAKANQATSDLKRLSDAQQKTIDKARQLVDSQRSARESAFRLLTRSKQGELLRDAEKRVNAAIKSGELSGFRVAAAIKSPEDLLRIASQADSLVDAQNSIATTNNELKAAINELKNKSWAVNVQVNADGLSNAYGDVLNGAVS
jgi:hypothetical protein